MHCLKPRRQVFLTATLNACESEMQVLIEVRKKAKIRSRYNQEPHFTQDTTWQSDKNTRKHRIQKGQEVSPFPAGNHKAAMNRHDRMTDTKQNNKKDLQKKHLLGMVNKNIPTGIMQYAENLIKIE